MKSRLYNKFFFEKFSFLNEIIVENNDVTKGGGVRVSKIFFCFVFLLKEAVLRNPAWPIGINLMKMAVGDVSDHGGWPPPTGEGGARAAASSAPDSDGGATGRGLRRDRGGANEKFRFKKGFKKKTVNQ